MVLAATENLFSNKSIEINEMKKYVFILALSTLTLAGCAGIDHLHTQPDGNGIYRAVDADNKRGYWNREGALRDSQGRLVESQDAADQQLRSNGSLRAFISSMAVQGCWDENVYKANVAQKTAMGAIRSGRFAEAEGHLSEARARCPKISWITNQSYLEAIVADARGKKENAKAALKEFIAYSSSTEPDIYVRVTPGAKGQDEHEKQMDEELAFYRKQARDYLEGKSETLPMSKDDEVPQIAKMYPNNPFRPGGNETPETLLVPVVGYSAVTGFALAVGAYKSWGKLSVAPSIIHTNAIGSIYGLRVRHSLFESENRDLNVDVHAFGGTWKSADFSYSSGAYKRVSPIRTGIDGGVGLGATRRFFYPSLGLSAGVIVANSSRYDRVKPFASLYGFYGLTERIDLFAGVLNNYTMAGITVSFVQFGYSFQDQGIRVQVNGVQF